MNKQVEFLVKLRDSSLSLAQAAEQYIESLAPPEIKEDNQKTEDKETVFNELNFEAEEGPKIGVFEAAYKADNLQDKWINAYNILLNSKATIKDRYHKEGYVHSYWLFEGNKIYRQKLKPK
jgi:hypothetical protein